MRRFDSAIDDWDSIRFVIFLRFDFNVRDSTAKSLSVDLSLLAFIIFVFVDILRCSPPPSLLIRDWDLIGIRSFEIGIR